jgi:hypothetical protein
MRSLTEDDLYAIAGHIYFKPKSQQKNGVVVKFTIKTVSKYKNNSFKKKSF